MSAEQVVVLALLVAAFAAGWIARGGGRAEEDEASGDAAAEPAGAAPATARAPLLRRTSAPPDVASDAARAVALASAAYETAVDRWLDERDAITPAGRAAVGELERAVQRLDTAAARLDEADETLGDAAYDALDALRRAVRHLEAFRDGRPLDAATSRALDGIEDELGRARAAFGTAPT